MEDLYTWFVKQTHSAASSYTSEDVDRPTLSPTYGADRSASALWVPLRRSDQKRLEAALLAAEVGLGLAEHIPVDGGRAEVKIEDRCYVDRFGVVPPPPPKPVRRVLWLRHTGGIDGVWQPYSEQMDEAIEYAYKLLIESAGESMEKKVQKWNLIREVPLNDGQNSVVHLQFNLSIDETTGQAQWNMLAEERSSASESPKRQTERPSFGWLSELKETAFNIKDATDVKRTPVKRGYGEVPLTDGCQEEEMLAEEVSRLVLYVHGAASEDAHCDAGRCLRRNFHRSQLQAMGVEEDIDGNWGPEDKLAAAQHQPKTEIIEVSWDQNMALNKGRIGSLNEQLERTSLPSMPRVREVMNRVSHGYLLYVRHRDEIMAAVQESLEAALWRFQSHHPDFSGEILLAGHSLSGVALFELLVEEKLTCQVSALYALGSPIGQLLEIDGTPPLEESKFAGGARFFNVYHPLDPVACRAEPLLMPELAARPPAKVPTERFPENAAELQHLQAFLSRSKEDLEESLSDCGSVVSSTRASSVPGAEEQRAARLAEFIGLRLYGRLDWVLQSESGCEVSPSEDLPDAALTSHLSYLRSFDVAAFMHGSCIQILQPAEPDRPLPVAKIVETTVNIFGQTVVKSPEAGSFWDKKTFWERASSSTAAGLKKLADSARDSANRSPTNQPGATDTGSDAPRVSKLWGRATAVYAAAKLAAANRSAASGGGSAAPSQEEARPD